MNNTYNIHIGDNQLILPTLPDNSVDSIVTDPPYELGFMGKTWDATGIAYNVQMWRECLRVLKPGGHLLAFSGSRTYHRMAVAIEDAGFQIRDQIMWVYGSGFPKSLNISKAIDKAAGAEREVIGSKLGQAGYSLAQSKGSPVYEGGFGGGGNPNKESEITAPATAEAKQWDGWGTALKPAHEPIVLARKPLDGTVANNVLTHGVGGLNIDGCRVGYSDDYDKKHQEDIRKGTGTFFGGNGVAVSPQIDMQGRFPANFIHDGSDEVLELFPDTSPSKAAARGGTNPNPMDWGNNRSDGGVIKGHTDNGGSAARFFYCAKANKKDRNEGLDGFEPKLGGSLEGGNDKRKGDKPQLSLRQNHHPTVKPTDLMRYLCRLITPPNGTILDPFTGSGSTGKAALLEGFNFIGIEQSEEYAAIAQARIEHVASNE